MSDAGLKAQFSLFAKFGDTRNDSSTITLKNSDKWMKQAGVLGKKIITTYTTGIAFGKYKTKNMDFTTFKKYLEEFKSIMPAEEIKQKLTDCGPPEPPGATAPSNFSWATPDLCAMARPNSQAHLRYLTDVAGISHLVTLSAECLPPIDCNCSELSWTLIDVEDCEPPTLQQISTFINICQQARNCNQKVGVHCCQGLGRTGVMLACHRVFFFEERSCVSIAKVRKLRLGSIETQGQEAVIKEYSLSL